MVTHTENGPCPDHHTAAHHRRRPCAVPRPPDTSGPTGCRPGRSMAGQARTQSSPEPNTLTTCVASRALRQGHALARPRYPTAPARSAAPAPRSTPSGPRARAFQLPTRRWASDVRPPPRGHRPATITRDLPATAGHAAAPHILRQPQAARPPAAIVEAGGLILLEPPRYPARHHQPGLRCRGAVYQDDRNPREGH